MTDAVRLTLDFSLSEGEAPARHHFADPVAVITAHRIGEVLPILHEVDAAARRGLWAVGFVAYEAAPAFDPAFVVRDPVPDLPLVWFALFAAPTPPQAATPPMALEEPSSWETDTSSEEWTTAIAAVHMAIAAGETYQVNLTRRLRRERVADVHELSSLYESLRAAQQGGRYGALLDTGRFQILSLSPELFFATEGCRIVTRPMKGTARRGRWSEEDEGLAEALVRSEKERAENVMIVDLLRSDLGRIARPGSVRVPHLFTRERYPTIWQMTSTIEAELTDSIRLPQVFAALFPCGSVTGAPKIRTMHHIAALERSPRGVYCGAVGVVQPGGDAVFNVAIRTLLQDRASGRQEYGVGAGITWDSRADTEWAETEAKSAVLLRSHTPPTFDLLETLRLEEGIYRLEERHGQRLEASARYFGRVCDRERIRETLRAFAEAHAAGDWRVRLCVAPDGTPRVEGAPLPERWLTLQDTPDSRPVIMAATPISHHDPFLFHKTTHRAVYEAHRAGIASEVLDVLLWNEAGEATEFTIGNLVAEIGGVLWTPPIDCGLLPGTLRAELLEQGIVQERRLLLDEVRSAPRLWLINSVRGWIPVRL